MPKTRKQRGGVAKRSKRLTYSQRRALERRRPIGLERSRRQSRFEFTRGNNRIVGSRPRMTRGAANNVVNLVRNMEARRGETTYQYIRSVRRLLKRISRDLEANDNDLAIQLATGIYPLLAEVQSDLGINNNDSNNNNNNGNLNADALEEAIDDLVDIINEYLSRYTRALRRGQLRRIEEVEAELELIAVTLDRGIQEARAEHAPAAAGNAEIAALAAQLAAIQPFRA